MASTFRSVSVTEFCRRAAPQPPGSTWAVMEALAVCPRGAGVYLSHHHCPLTMVAQCHSSSCFLSNTRHYSASFSFHIPQNLISLKYLSFLLQCQPVFINISATDQRGDGKRTYRSSRLTTATSNKSTDSKSPGAQHLQAHRCAGDK